MKVGLSMSILAEPGRPDAAVYGEHLMLGDLAEPLGFDSIWALEHHFTGYSMSLIQRSCSATLRGAPSGSCSVLA